MPLWTMVWNFPCAILFLWWEADLPMQVCCMNTHALAILVKNQLWSSVGWGLPCGPWYLQMRMTEVLTSTRVDCHVYTNSTCCYCCSVAKYLWTAACQASLSVPLSWSLLKFSCPLNGWCHPTLLFSANPFSLGAWICRHPYSFS